MTDPKPRGVPYQSWIDQQVRAAQERGEFDNLPGAGKPIPGRGEPDDELWWVKQYMRRENLSFPLPPALALRKEAEDVLTAVARERSEAAVRRVVADLNSRIDEATRRPSSGPQLRSKAPPAPLDVERVVRDWRERRQLASAPAGYGGGMAKNQGRDGRAGYSRGLPDYHDPTAGIGGAAPARSALTLRAVLAGFGLVICAVGAVLALRVDLIGWGVLLAVLAAVALVDLVWVLRRKLRGEPG